MQAKTQLAMNAVRKAACLTMAVQDELSGAHASKDDRSPVTIADFGAQAIIGYMLNQAEPGFAMVSEEDAAFLKEPDQTAMLEKVRVLVSEHLGLSASCEDVLNWIDAGKHEDKTTGFWTLDPIDGTKGFLRGDQYAIALAWVVDEQPQVAALGCPKLPIDMHDESTGGCLLYAEAGSGSQMIGIKAGQDKAVTLQVSKLSESAGFRLCESFESSHSKHGVTAELKSLLGVQAEPVRIDSQAKYAVVARGDAEIYLRAPTRRDYVEKIWDHAAGSLVLTEAGGMVTDATGRELKFNATGQLMGYRGILATHGQAHKKVINTLNDLI